MPSIRRFFAVLVLWLSTCFAFAREPVALPLPLPDHPRLFVSSADWDRLRSQVHTDPFSQAVFGVMEAYAKQLLDTPPAERVMEGRRLLETSRMVLERVSVLCLVARVTGEPVYAERAAKELRAVARFSDWNPSHFLDVAEMSLAVAIGYDWIYDLLSPEDRAEIAKALLEKGIEPSFSSEQKNLAWVAGENNWTQVCHAGISAAAIALADADPALTARVLNRAIENVPKAALQYAPDGIYIEGAGYWNYGTSFHVLLIAALERLTGSAHGLDTLPGFAQSPLYFTEITAPSGLFFNFSDSGERRGITVPLYWFARCLHHPEWTQGEVENAPGLVEGYTKVPHRGNRLLAFALLWRDPALDAAGGGKALTPLQWMGRGKNPIAVHRSAFGDPAAAYVAIKGGSPLLSHAHMDGGSFILEADGVRWAVDLGMEPYTGIEAKGIKLWDRGQTGQRWTVFRIGPESHNILRFNGASQQVAGTGSLVRFQGEGDHGASVFDLSPLYADQVAAVRRGVRLLPSKAILIQDEWTAKAAPVEVAWQMMTRAEVTVRPGSIELRQEGKTLTLRILEPAEVKVEVRKAEELQQSFDSDNRKASRIVIQMRTAAGQQGKIRLLAVPGSIAEPPAPAFEPLLSWASPL